MSLAKLKMLLAEPYFNDLFELHKAIQLASGETDQKLLKLHRRAAQLAGKEIRPKPLLDGYELIALGVTAGPMVGLAAQELYIAQLSEEIHTKSEAKEWLGNWLEKHKTLFS
jgi:hypothetical protein